MHISKNCALVLVINCGSSSLKFALYETGNKQAICNGLAEALGKENASIRITTLGASDQSAQALSNATHKEALQYIIEVLKKEYDLDQSLIAVGHRVVHGGESFSKATVVDNSVLESIRNCIALAPLHNPANIIGIELAQASFPGLPQVAVFDTAFHQTMPERAFHYALPAELYEEHAVRRYGFHGTSHDYVARATAQFIGKPLEQCSFITAHLGNGASVCAIEKGQSVDTSMGMTPLEGLVMGTRSGDIDPGIFAYLLRLGYSGEEIDTILNKQSGLLGLSGKSNDMRTLQSLAEDGDKRAELAIEIFCFRLAKYIAAMRVSLSGLDGLIFTGGIGENSQLVRALTSSHLIGLGLEVDDKANQQRGADIITISAGKSLPIFVTKTNEEFMIAEQSASLCLNSKENQG